MGQWKLYNAALAMRDFSLRQQRQVSVRPYKAIDGTTSSVVAINSFSGGTFDANTKSALQASPYEPLTAYVSSDKYSNYNIDDYAVNEVGTTTKTVTRTNQNGKSSNIYTLVCVNEGESEISVGCIKFTKPIPQNAYNESTLTCLMYAYFFDSEIIIGAGETKTFTVTISAD